MIARAIEMSAHGQHAFVHVRFGFDQRSKEVEHNGSNGHDQRLEVMGV